jgi:hypothetical protein
MKLERNPPFNAPTEADHHVRHETILQDFGDGSSLERAEDRTAT